MVGLADGYGELREFSVSVHASSAVEEMAVGVL
jgi:hypothetical protein